MIIYMRKTLVFRTYFLLIFLIAVSGCRRWRTEKNSPQKVFRAYAATKVTGYSLTIGGIECKQCVHTVLKKLDKISGVNRVTCVCPKNDYTKSRIDCIVDSVHDFPLALIKKVLLINDFSLTFVNGEFHGLVKKNDDNTFSFVINGDESIFGCQASDIVIAEWLQQNIITRDINAVGTLDLEHNRFIIEQIV